MPKALASLAENNTLVPRARLGPEAGLGNMKPGVERAQHGCARAGYEILGALLGFGTLSQRDFQ